ncbi:MAG TPA: hypothetical protein VF473_02440 [Cyclobacteriaceae bacterium]
MIWPEFKSFPFDKQLQTLYETGVFIMGIRYYGYKVNLYLIGDFYVEVFYNHKKDFIEKIIPLDTCNSRIKFYVDQIKLPTNLF